MAHVVTGPARCIECNAVWRVLHVLRPEAGCIYCGGALRPLGTADVVPFRRLDQILAAQWQRLDSRDQRLGASFDREPL